MAHCFSVRVYYEDTDAGGVVYYANYLKFAERARTEALRQIGIEQSTLLNDHQIAFVVRHCNIDFIKPARLDDLLTIQTTVHDIGAVSIIMKQSIMCNDITVASLEVTLACVTTLMKPAKLPTSLKTAMINAFQL